VTSAALFDRARAAITASGFDSDTQTRIALFVGTVKSMNALLLCGAELLPATSAAYPFMHGQLYRESELTSLLMRVTQWSSNPVVYWQGAALAAPLWREWWRIQGPLGTIIDRDAAYRGVAFGHALLARVRLAPLMPEGVDELDAFVVALRRVEQESGRMIQAQIRLLKDAPVAIEQPERERIVEEEQAVVNAAFEHFIDDLGSGGTPTLPWLARTA
jgi:hypothetical protein